MRPSDEGIGERTGAALTRRLLAPGFFVEGAGAVAIGRGSVGFVGLRADAGLRADVGLRGVADFTAGFLAAVRFAARGAVRFRAALREAASFAAFRVADLRLAAFAALRVRLAAGRRVFLLAADFVRVAVPVARFRFAIGLCPRLLRLRWCSLIRPPAPYPSGTAGHPRFRLRPSLFSLQPSPASPLCLP
jgi:hypothetical protein